jgi:glycosyltransferase involved in cell wall biosynthesis
MTRVAYLASRYPAVTHTFILREVRAVRALGIDIDTFTVRAVSDAEVRTPVDAEEHARTTALLPLRPLVAARAALAALRHPRATVSTARYAWSRATPGLRAHAWQLFYVAESLLLHVHLRRRSVTHVHVHFANVAADVARLRTRFARMADPSGTYTWSFTMHGPTELADVTLWDLAAKTSDAALVACISDFCRSQLMAIVDDDVWPRLQIVRCGVDVDAFPLVDRTGRSGTVDVLCVGQLVARKGQHVLVDAIASLASRGVDVRATVAGDGPSRAALESSVAARGLGDRVRFTGAVGQDEIARLLREADVFCLPSFAEGVPVSLMEAMATGLPVISTRIAGTPELIDDGRSGLLVAPGRADQLAAAVEQLVTSPPRRAAHGAAGRVAGIARYQVGESAQVLAEHLRSLA